MDKECIKVCVTGAAGNLAYSFLPMLVSGQVFGPRISIHLTLLDIASKEYALKGLYLELEDGAFPLLKKIEYGTDPKKMFEGCKLVLFLGGSSRKPGQERVDLLQTNGAIFKEQGQALNEVGRPDCKCLVVANPCHTNCYILRKNCPKLPNENFHALSRLDHNRALVQLSYKIGVEATKIKKMTVWGNHSVNQYPDLSHAEVNGKKVVELINDERYVTKEFISQIQQRGAEVLHQRKKSAVLSGARALVDHLRDWYFGTEDGDWVSIGVVSNGAYGVPEGLVFSFPVTCQSFGHKIVEDLTLSTFSKEQIQTAIDELVEERDEAVYEFEC